MGWAVFLLGATGENPLLCLPVSWGFCHSFTFSPLPPSKPSCHSYSDLHLPSPCKDLPVYQADTGGLLRTFQCIRQTQEDFSGPSVYQADTGGLLRTFQCIRHTQEVFSGPQSVTGRHRRSSQDFQCNRQTQEVFLGPSSVTGRHRGLLSTLGVLKVCRAWESSERGPLAWWP